MITTKNLEVLAEKLRVYDVVQGAWEQEPNGFDANASHVLTHLTKDVFGKDFGDAALVSTAIAPDSLQYGLRLARWASVVVSDLAVLDDSDEEIRDEIEASLGHREMPWGFTCFAAATRILALHLHDCDHRSTREAALKSRAISMQRASRLLIFSASIQAYQHEFDLSNAFDNRLAHLRERFGIPQP